MIVELKLNARPAGILQDANARTVRSNVDEVDYSVDHFHLRVEHVASHRAAAVEYKQQVDVSVEWAAYCNTKKCNVVECACTALPLARSLFQMAFSRVFSNSGSSLLSCAPTAMIRANANSHGVIFLQQCSVAGGRKKKRLTE